jgi:hypothetical protein
VAITTSQDAASFTSDLESAVLNHLAGNSDGTSAADKILRAFKESIVASLNEKAGINLSLDDIIIDSITVHTDADGNVTHVTFNYRIKVNSAWDAFYLAMFWMLNTISWVTFYWHWKHMTIWGGNAAAFNESSTYIMGWLRDYLWLNSSPLINGYNAQGMNAQAVWAHGFLFLLVPSEPARIF